MNNRPSEPVCSLSLRPNILGRQREITRSRCRLEHIHPRPPYEALVPGARQRGHLRAAASTGAFRPSPLSLCSLCDPEVVGHDRLHPVALEPFHVLTRRLGSATAIQRCGDQHGQYEKSDHSWPVCLDSVRAPDPRRPQRANAGLTLRPEARAPANSPPPAAAQKSGRAAGQNQRPRLSASRRPSLSASGTPTRPQGLACLPLPRLPVGPNPDATLPAAPHAQGPLFSPA